MKNDQNLRWWQRGVIYQIYPRSFKDTTGNGIGDLAGIIEKLDYLNDGTPASLGIDAIWLSPIYPSPMADFGYDVADYCAIHPLFGDLATFDRLITEAHRRGIKIILDYVPNHTSDQHPWFIESRRSLDNPKRDWYIWRDPGPEGGPPNNWGSAFGGPAWTWDETTGQYYLHQFLKEQPELNWRNPEVRAAMMDVLRFWLERGVDGFRMDVVGLLIKDAELRDNPPNPDADPNLPPNDIFGRQLHVYNQDQDEVHEIIRDFRQLLDEYGNRCGIGELWFELPRWIRYYGENNDGLHLPFNFRLMALPWQAQAIHRSVDELEAALPAFAWPNYVLGNHDSPRLASRLGGQAQARVAAMMLLTLRGTPTLYYGDELGLENGVIPPEKIQDPLGINLGAERTRDVGRTPMQWDASPNAGFSRAKPWLPVSNDYAMRNVAAQSADPTSILNLYRRLLWYRRGSPALYGGSYHSLDSNDDCFVYLRVAGDERRLIALNFADDQRQVSIPGENAGQIVISTSLDRQESISPSGFELRPHEGVIVEL
ncbi:MAG: alpha-amylase family glycosyl hydrolase [Anaerolineae bacterium]|jgi:alpha-glucosidase|nr:alpha-amylase family glycosyl hydrolase [Anaerolineae bacterium]MDH7473647.1 alpha-amylase family glycosyl hydrolase [Anaerolineae bacterium]